MDVQDMIREAFGSDTPPEPIAEAQIERLQEAFGRMKAPCPFKVGDLVRPRKDSPLKKNTVSLVVDVNPMGFERGLSDCCEWTNAAVFDLKIIRLIGDSIVPFVAPSWMYEPYTAD